MSNRLAVFLPIPLLLFIQLCGCAKKERASDASAGAKTGGSVASGLENTGFETGSLSPWETYLDPKAMVTSAQAHSGSDSVQESGEGSVFQDVTGLEPGRTYTVSAWASASPNAAAPGYIAIWDPSANVATFSSVVTPKSGWQLVTHSATVKGTTLRIHLFRGSGTGNIYWDDVRLYSEK